MKLETALAAVAATVAVASPAIAASYDVVGDYGSANFAYSYGSYDGLVLTSPLSSVFTGGCFGQATLACRTPEGAGDSTQPVIAKNTGTDPIAVSTVVIPTNQLLLHPGPNVTGQDAILEFIAPEAGIYSIAGAFTRLDTTTTGDPNNGGEANNGVFVAIYQTAFNGGVSTPILASAGLFGAGGNSVPISLGSLSLGAGDRIAFAVANAGNYVYDSTGLQATISSSAVPEPATWAMMILGFAVIGYALRHPKRLVWGRTLDA